ncbi:LolA family protein [Micromonospora sp. CPCC 206061]|uniref:LolA family protein n=1 Tax=Micromonospora sp. CPCC 206061 TaxID=3122410 RepID=UPI002FF31610
MSVTKSRPALRWLVPAVATVVVIGGGAAVGTFAASADPSLPPRTAAQLLVDLQTARLDGLSGTVVQTSDLGLPSLPDLGGGNGSADLMSLITGDNTLRVWYSGPDKARVALMGTLGETDIIRNGSDVWLWESKANKATHSKLSGTEAGQKHTLPNGVPSTPQEAADKALAAIDPSTEVTTSGTAKVAGRDAYELVLRPRDTTSLVGQVRIAIDATEHVPLRFEVLAKDSDKAAFQVAFTQVDFERPDDQQFEFNPPPGVKVEESTELAPQQKAQQKDKAHDAVTTVGEGWTTVAVAKYDGAAPSGSSTSEQGAAGLLKALPEVNGAWGSGHLLTGTVFSVLLTDDGRILAGLVSPERLYEVAATKAGK